MRSEGFYVIVGGIADIRGLWIRVKNEIIFKCLESQT